MATLVIKTNASETNPITVPDMGIVIPGSGGSDTLIRLGDLEDARISQDLRDLATDDAFGAGSSTLILNDGAVDIAQADTGSFLDFINVSTQNNSAASDPGVSDDATKGYKINSLWTNTSTKDVFRCTDPATGAATWKKAASGDSGPGHSHDRQEFKTSTEVSRDATVYDDIPFTLITTNNSEDMTYIITFTAEAKGSSSSKDIYIRILVDGVVVTESERVLRPQSGNKFFTLATSAVSPTVGDGKIVKIQWRSGTANQVFSIRARSLIIDGITTAAVTS